VLELGQVVRDLDFMQQRAAGCGEHNDDDPFYLKSSKELDRLAMVQAGLIPDHVLPVGNLQNALDRDHPRLPGVARTTAVRSSKSGHWLSRLALALAGGLSLIVPVILMVKFPGPITSLVTTCSSLLLFAFAVTFGTDIRAYQILAKTAAYAAVLVVFVGTSQDSY
jgi:hypothetical protein